MTPSRTITALCALTLTTAFLSACGGTQPTESTNTPTTASPSTEPTLTEERTLASRIALTYDGGIMVVNGHTMKLINTLPAEGFLRLNPTGDNRHLAVSDGSSYRILDMGMWEQEHGDHSHIYSTEPALSSLELQADHTGHVISNHGKTAFFADGTGSFDVLNPADLTGEDQFTATDVATEKVTLPDPHHGFAIPLENDRFLVSVGTEEERTGAAVIDSHGKVILENHDCPGVHGEALAAQESITIGCEDGVLVYKDSTFHKIENQGFPYSRSGNMASDPQSDVVLADFKTDPDAELERPEQFALVNTTTLERTRVELPEGVSYTFRSLARGPHGEALLLTTDGKLRFFDQQSGKELGAIELMKPWQESDAWQDPRPALWVDGNTAYVTDPSTKKLIAVSLSRIQEGHAEKIVELELPHTPNEISGVTGKAASHAHDHSHAH